VLLTAVAILGPAVRSESCIPAVHSTLQDMCSCTVDCRSDIRERDRRPSLYKAVGVPCLEGYMQQVAEGVDQVRRSCPRMR
jgi:hypothetical protein